MKRNIHLLLVFICFVGCAIYLAVDARSLVAQSAEDVQERVTGGPLFRAPVRSVLVEQDALQRLVDLEKAIYDTMSLLMNELKTMPRAAELAEQLKQLVTDYIDLATKVVKQK